MGVQMVGVWWCMDVGVEEWALDRSKGDRYRGVQQKSWDIVGSRATGGSYLRQVSMG